MIVDRKWMERNVGFDPLSVSAPATTFSFARAAKTSSPEDLQREIIDFDSEAPEGKEFLSFTATTGLIRFTEIPWPKALGPETAKRITKRAGGELPQADVLVVTWTVDEGHATSRVLTPGKDAKADYLPYRRNFAALSKMFRKDCPALEADMLGAYWKTTIGDKSVVVFKSESHLSQDGPLVPNIEVWRQIIADVQPKLVLTTGTGGGIGTRFEVGDVIVSPVVHFDCLKKFKAKFGNEPPFQSSLPNTKYFAKAGSLVGVNAAQLPKDNPRLPMILSVPANSVRQSVVTTDFFGFDTTSNYYKLWGQGSLSEMGDAVLGLVCSQMGANAPKWLAVRNVSDPEIKSAGLTLKQQANMAAQIYKAYGRWSTVCSAIVCWALIAAL